MGARRGAAGLLAAALACATVAAAAAPSSQCTLAIADRSSTPVSACTGCHGEGLRNQPPSGGQEAAAVRSSSFQMPGHEFGHAVDVDFDAARAANPSAFVARDRLPAYLPLVDGKIACVTCHDGRAGHRSSLARATQKEMCLACHAM